MASFQNKQGIGEIELYAQVNSFCPMGNDWYDADVTVKFTPGDVIMDYCDIDKFFAAISGGELIIEDMVAQTFDHFMTYEPKGLVVEAFVSNATHLPVNVKKAL